MGWNAVCDYSAAYATFYIDYDLVGHGMTFTIGRGEIVSHRDVALFEWRDAVRVFLSLAKVECWATGRWRYFARAMNTGDRVAFACGFIFHFPSRG